MIHFKNVCRMTEEIVEFRVFVNCIFGEKLLLPWAAQTNCRKTYPENEFSVYVFMQFPPRIREESFSPKIQLTKTRQIIFLSSDRNGVT